VIIPATTDENPHQGKATLEERLHSLGITPLLLELAARINNAKPSLKETEDEQDRGIGKANSRTRTLSSQASEAFKRRSV
jgi:hypothetical protein